VSPLHLLIIVNQKEVYSVVVVESARSGNREIMIIHRICSKPNFISTTKSNVTFSIRRLTLIQN
jgi:hypothetical protein